jgi:YD repeat-containing protein
MRLTSPNQSWVRFTYGPANHIAEIDDSRGRNVRYGYDERNRLTTVSYPSGEVFHYEYDDQQHLLTVSVSPDAGAAPRVLLRNEYVNGRVTKQTFADGGVYAYGYYPAGAGPIKMVVMTAPGGKRYLAQITAGGSIVRERDTASARSTQ